MVNETCMLFLANKIGINGLRLVLETRKSYVQVFYDFLLMGDIYIWNDAKKKKKNRRVM